MSDTESSRFSAETTITARAPIEQVWALIADARGWSRWARLSTSALERQGEREPDGVGAIRRFTTGPLVSREEVVAFEPPRRLVYTLLSGMPLRDYRGEVTLDPTPDGGTRITWRSTFEPRYPGTGWLLVGFMRMVLGDYARRLAAAAARGVGAA